MTTGAQQAAADSVYAALSAVERAIDQAAREGLDVYMDTAIVPHPDLPGKGTIRFNPRLVLPTVIMPSPGSPATVVKGPFEKIDGGKKDKPEGEQ